MFTHYVDCSCTFKGKMSGDLKVPAFYNLSLKKYRL